MDHDALDQDVKAIKRFLDVAAPGWRDPEKLNEHRRRNWDIGDTQGGHPDMVIDHEQTRRDRIALGLEQPDDQAKDLGESKPQSGADLDANGKPIYGRADGDRNPALKPAPEAVALGAANGSQELEKALETEQNPRRAADAEAQREQKFATEDAGGIPAESVRPAGR
jgi:hypothetical protein